ncbi:hypothetical protein BJY01DRAFT_126493 [Aspergillus pseudoustus]|uniref:Uncharacterized protein n=1 Tax=Aspergillus pseudoustus TaxID=1810923 RepID=A0ABR4IMX9_9EURO
MFQTSPHGGQMDGRNRPNPFESRAHSPDIADASCECGRGTGASISTTGGGFTVPLLSGLSPLSNQANHARHRPHLTAAGARQEYIRRFGSLRLGRVTIESHKNGCKGPDPPAHVFPDSVCSLWNCSSFSFSQPRIKDWPLRRGVCDGSSSARWVSEPTNLSGRARGYHRTSGPRTCNRDSRSYKLRDDR